MAIHLQKCRMGGAETVSTNVNVHNKRLDGEGVVANIKICLPFPSPHLVSLASFAAMSLEGGATLDVLA
jgi:hypothetical protein